MKLAGLAGGIGCGKSTVAACFKARGAVVLDVDLLSRELQNPGQPVFEAMVHRWGYRILTAAGTLNRQAVADIVFHARAEMAALMAITSPAVEDALCTRAEAYQDTDHVVLLESALFARDPRQYGIAGLIVVDAPEEVAVRRLVGMRGMSESDARARIANQPPRDLRLRAADLLIDNGGTLEALDADIDRAWSWLGDLPDGLVRRSNR